MPTCTSGWRRTSSSPARPCEPMRPCSRRTGWASRPSGDTASRATGRSSWPGSPSRPSSPWPGSSWSRTPSSGSRAWSPTSSLLDEERRQRRRASASSSARWSREAGADDLPTSRGGLRARREQACPRTRFDPARGGGPRRPRRRPGRSCRPARPHRVGPVAARGPGSHPAAQGHWDDEPVRLPSDLAVRQRPGRLHPRRPRILPAHPRPRARTPTSLERPARPPGRRPSASCRRPPGSTSSPTPTFGFLVSEGGLGIHLGGQQPDQPPDALEQRPGHRPPRRSRLPPRRGDRRDLVPDPPARPLARPRRSSATARATRSSSGTRTASSTS